MTSIKDQLAAAIAARKDTLKALRDRIIDITDGIPVGVKLSDNAGLVAKVVRVCTGASQWANQTWNVTITGWALITEDGKLIAESLDDSRWDGSNMHYRKTEPTCLGSRGYDDNGNIDKLSFASGKETRALAARLPEAISRYMAECETEAAANASTLAVSA